MQTNLKSFHKGKAMDILTIIIRFAQGNAVFNFIRTKKVSHAPPAAGFADVHLTWS